MEKHTKQIRVRVSEEFETLIIFYAGFHGIDKSKAIRELIEIGLMKKAHIGLLKKIQDELRQKNPDPMTVETCEKCGTIADKLLIYHIDKNTRNTDSKNRVVLCINCFSSLQRFIQKYNAKEKFVAWFLL